MCSSTVYLDTSHEALITVKRQKLIRLLVIRPGKGHFASHCEGSKKKGKTAEAMGRQHQRVDRTGLPRVAEGCGRQTELESAGCQMIVR